MTICILLVDDHRVVRQGLRMLLQLDSELEVVGEAGNGLEALEIARKTQPDVVLMDLLMPEMDGVEATRAIKHELPQTSVVALTSSVQATSVVRALRAGANGYVSKDVGADDLFRAIRAAMAGQVQLPLDVMDLLNRDQGTSETLEALSPRELEVLTALGEGLSNREIGERLHIGEKTVKTHVSNILNKLGIQSRTQAALFASRAGLVSGNMPDTIS